MKKLISLLLPCFLLCTLLCSCGQRAYPLLLTQDSENITKIELINNTVEYGKVEYTLAEDEFEEFIASLLDMSYHIQHPPCTTYGYLAVRLHYDNGDIETFGTGALGYTSSEEEELDGKYYVPLDTMCELFSEYIDKEMVSKIYNDIYFGKYMQ